MELLIPWRSTKRAVSFVQKYCRDSLSESTGAGMTRITEAWEKGPSKAEGVNQRKLWGAWPVLSPCWVRQGPSYWALLSTPVEQSCQRAIWPLSSLRFPFCHRSAGITDKCHFSVSNCVCSRSTGFKESSFTCWTTSPISEKIKS